MVSSHVQDAESWLVQVFSFNKFNPVLVLRFLVWKRFKTADIFLGLEKPLSGEWPLSGAADLLIVLHQKLQIMVPKLTRKVKVDNQIEGLCLESQM